MDRKKIFVIVLVLLLTACDKASVVSLQIGEVVAEVEIAATYDSRSKGLMHRSALGENQGMLLVFPRDEVLKLWMLNVHIPLDAAFFDSQGRLINTVSMEPDGGKTIYRSLMPARYALEMNKGWFSRHDLAKGDLLHLTPALKQLPVE